ncbi:MAG: (2Fe-2S)-binding protein [Butyrivibrio sp.]|nr:(2Fe-2S)-binding protein [Butyrivibrio sp.]
MKKDKLACHCKNVNYGQILDAVKNGADTYEKVSAVTGCGTGCGKCKDFIVTMIRDIQMFPEDYD